jgi:hypothetical protein
MNQEGKEVKKTYDATTFDDIPDLEWFLFILNLL